MPGCDSNCKEHAICNFFSRVKYIVSILFFIINSLLVFQKTANCIDYNVNLPHNLQNIAFAEENQDDVIKELENETNNILDGLDLSQVEEFFQENQTYYENAFGVYDYKDLLQKLVSGELSADFPSIISFITQLVKDNIGVFLSPLIIVFVVFLLSSLFKSIRPKIAENSISKIIFFISYTVAVTIVSYLFFNCLSSVNSAINKMQTQMNASLPIVLTLMSTANASVSVKAYRPLVLILSNVISNIFIKILLPIVVICFVLSVVGGMTNKNNLKGITDFFSSAFKWILGLSLTIYTAFMTIQGITASSADGITIRATKYAIKNYVPMLGGYISDGFEVARVGSIIIKNAVGFGGIIIMIFTMLSPILIIMAFQLSIKLVLGLSGVVDDGNSKEIFSGTSKSLTMLMVCLIAVFMMYFVSMMLLVYAIGGAI